MRRRTIIISAGAPILAGCTGGGDNSDGSSEATVSTTQSTSSLTTSEIQQTTQPSGSTDTEATEKTTTSETETKSRTEVLIDRSKDELAEVVEQYLSYSSKEEPSLLDVNASSTDFVDGVVQQEANEALQDIYEAEDVNKGEFDSVIQDLFGIHTFFKYSIQVQGHLVAAFEHLEKANEHFEERNFNSILNETTNMRGKATDADDDLTTLKDETTSESMNAVSFLSRDLYSDKIAQFENEIESFNELFDGLRDFANGLLSFAISWDEYHDRDDEFYRFEDDDFASSREILEVAPRPESTAGYVNDFECEAGSYEDASIYMDSAAVARANNDVDSAKDYEERAEEALDRCEE